MLAVFRLVAVSYVCNILYLVCSCNCDVQIKAKKKKKDTKKPQNLQKNPQTKKKNPNKPPSTNTTQQSPLLQELVKTEANNAMI